MTSPPIYHSCKNCKKVNIFMGEPEEYRCPKCRKINKIFYFGRMRLFTTILMEKKCK